MSRYRSAILLSGFSITKTGAYGHFNSKQKNTFIFRVDDTYFTNGETKHRKTTWNLDAYGIGFNHVEQIPINNQVRSNRLLQLTPTLCVGVSCILSVNRLKTTFPLLNLLIH
jgi:hypothetical protein